MAAGNEVHVFAEIVAQPGKADEVRDVLIALVAAIKQEPGVIHYQLHEDTKKPGAFFFFEAYENQAALDAHMNSPNLKKAFAAAVPLLTGAPIGHFTKLLAGA